MNLQNRAQAEQRQDPNWRWRSLACALALLWALPAAAWWDEAWTMRKQITVDTSAEGANVAAANSDAVVLVRLHAGNFTQFATLAANANDLRFVAADDTTLLPFHIERFDAAAEIGLIWVRLPQVPGGSNQTTFFMYFGNAEAAAAADAAATFGDDALAVWHFDDAAGQVRDATRRGAHATSGAVRPHPAGLIGAAAGFDGATRASVASVPGIASSGGSLRAWLQIDAPQDDAVVVDWRDAAGVGWALAIAGTTPYLQWYGGGDSEPVLARNDATTLVPKTWTHIAVAFAEGKVALVVNGTESASATIDAAAATGGSLTLGAMADGSRPARGVFLDEVRIRAGALDPARTALDIASEGIGGNLLRYGGDAGPDDGEAAEPSYFLITLQNVTFDGWVVIVVLILMFVLSLIVMAQKGLTIRALRRDNSAFLKAFRESDVSQWFGAANVTAAAPAVAGNLLDAGRFAGSTTYELFDLGVREARKRIPGGADDGPSHGFRRGALDAIRAALHAANVRLGQRLNAGMVLLTLCISGGPFLGLLGTVVGVMITFAAIAHTGEVDVSAIAPGTAAALAATVAGLAVAIPALFAYNYLTIRIREIASENDAFLEEFVTRVAERFGE